MSRIAIDNSAARNLRNAVTDRQTPYTQRGVHFERAHHALRQPEHTFAMKIARLLSTSTRKAGHTPRLPPPTRDVAAEVPRPRHTHLQASLPARTWPEFEFSHICTPPPHTTRTTTTHGCARRETVATHVTASNHTGRRARGQVAGAPLEGRRTALLRPGRGGLARHAPGRGAVPGRHSSKTL